MTKDEIIEALEACRTREVGLKHIEAEIMKLTRRRAIFCQSAPTEEKCKDRRCCVCERIRALQFLLRHRTNQALRLKNRCERIINHVADPTEREILSLYFIDGESWKEVGKTLHYSESAIMVHRRKALAQLTKKLKEREIC